MIPSGWSQTHITAQGDPDRHRPTAAQRRLAVAVLRQAILDAGLGPRYKTWSDRHKGDADRFLQGLTVEMRRRRDFWCLVLGLDPQALVDALYNRRDDVG